MKKLPRSFYENPDVITLARSLVGKRLITRLDGKTTSGIITETEAYAGTTDRASHAYGGRMTNRTKVMYMRGGTAYVYLCYGIHSLFNVVTNREGIPDAILIRSLEPENGIEEMKIRRNCDKLSPALTCGPGNLSMAMGINRSHTGESLLGREIWIEDTETECRLSACRRIGVDYAGTDAKKNWRFLLADSQWVTYPPQSAERSRRNR